jgi:hypothetical protein
MTSQAAAIRSEDTMHLIFYEPVTWGMIFDGNITGSGFEYALFFLFSSFFLFW